MTNRLEEVGGEVFVYGQISPLLLLCDRASNRADRSALVAC